jgi:HSP20 family protein
MTFLTRRYDPFNDIRSLQSQMNRLFEPFWSRPGEEDLVSGTWVPAVDVEEIGDEIVLRAELPGMKQEDIDISFNDGILTIRGERQFEKETQEKTWHRIERSYGSFVRSFTMPRSVDAGRITADYRDGVLAIHVPKREESKPRQIKIGSGGEGDGKKISAA